MQTVILVALTQIFNRD